VSVVGVIRMVRIAVQIQDDGVGLALLDVLFREDGFGNHIFLAGPITEVPFAASLATERKIRVDRGIRFGFADRTFVFHGAFLFFSANLVFSAISA
jgi:hypothetical protein